MNPERGRQRMDLPLDLMEPIAKHLLANDVVDYISFRAVCRDWRSRMASPRSFTAQFRPRRWTPLPYFGSHPSASMCFLNLHTGRALVLDRFPELESHSIISVCDGLLVLLDKHDLTTVRVFNPFTRHMSDHLPPLLYNLQHSEYSWVKLPVDQMLAKYELKLKHCPFTFMINDDVDDSPACPTLMFYTPCESIDFAKPGDRTWQTKIRTFMGIIVIAFFKGTVYYINTNCELLSANPKETRARELVDLDYDARVDATVLVEFDSKLLLVRRIGELVPHSFEIFRVDLESSTLVPFNDFGEYALFIGMNRQTVIVSSRCFPNSIRPNSIYCFYVYTDSTFRYPAVPGHARTAVYSLSDGSIELLSHFRDEDDSLHPRTLADYLFKHCSIPQW